MLTPIIGVTVQVWTVSSSTLVRHLAMFLDGSLIKFADPELTYHANVSDNVVPDGTILTVS
jgi:hypothetical protein